MSWLPYGLFLLLTKTWFLGTGLVGRAGKLEEPYKVKKQYRKISHLWDLLVAGAVTKCSWKKAIIQWYCNSRKYAKEIFQLLRTTVMATMKMAARAAVLFCGERTAILCGSWIVGFQSHKWCHTAEKTTVAPQHCRHSNFCFSLFPDAQGHQKVFVHFKLLRLQFHCGSNKTKL